MASKTATLLVVVLVFATGFTARIVYEQTVRPAFAQDDPRTGLDCEDYGSQAEAQAALREQPSDPNVLDEDDDGIACEPTRTTTRPPTKYLSLMSFSSRAHNSSSDSNPDRTETASLDQTATQCREQADFEAGQYPPVPMAHAPPRFPCSATTSV